MPPAIIGAAIALGASAAAAAGIIAASTALVIGMAATAAGALLTKKPSFDFNAYKGQQERKQVLRAAAAPRTVVYGETIASGVMFFAEEQPGDQVDGEWLHMGLALAGHELHSMGEVWLGDEISEAFGDNVSFELHNNRQTSDPFMLQHCPSWKDDMIGKGIAWLRISFKFDAEKFPSGLPNVRVRKQGRRVYDPRSKEMVYTSNAALVILDYLRVYLKRNDDRILWDQFIAAANICDERVINADQSQSRRYTINGEFDIDEAPSKILDGMLEACAGELTYVGGKYGLLVGAYYGPATMVLDESCIAGDIKIVPETSFKERTNTMTGTFIDPAQNYSEADFPTVSVAEWIEKDGQEITQDVKYRFVTDGYQAQRLANITLRRKRIGRTIEIPCNLRGYKFRPGMYVKVRIAALGMKDVEMRITKWSFDPKGGVSLTVRQDFAAMWDDAIGKPIDRPDLVDLPTGGVAQPQNLQYQVLQISDVVQGVLSWTNFGQVAYNRVAVRQGGTTVWTAQVPGQSVRVAGLLRGGYTAHVTAVGYNGAISPEAYLEFNIQAPPPPTSVTIEQGYFAITLIPHIAELANVSTQYDFWTSGETKLASTNTDVVEAQATRKGISTTWTSEGLQNDHTYYWYVRTINAFGSSGFVEVEAVCYTSTTELIPMIDAELKNTETFKELMSEVKKVEDGVTETRQEIIDQDKKFTQQIQSVQSTVGEVSATVQETKSALATLDGQVSSQWGMKVQVDQNGKKFVAGMQLGVEGQGGEVQSYAMFNADNFAIYNSVNGASVPAFIAKGGQLFMPSTFIENGTIDNAKIGNVLTSYDWNGVDKGWAIVKDGWAHFNNVTVRGTVYATNGEFRGTVYATNGQFKGTVEADSFVGDVANMNFWPDAGGIKEVSRYMTYTDTTQAQTVRKVIILANIRGVGTLIMNINGIERRIMIDLAASNATSCLMHSAVVTSPTINAHIRISSESNKGLEILAPTMLICRGSGSFG